MVRRRALAGIMALSTYLIAPDKLALEAFEKAFELAVREVESDLQPPVDMSGRDQRSLSSHSQAVDQVTYVGRRAGLGAVRLSLGGKGSPRPLIQGADSVSAVNRLEHLRT